MTRRLRAHELTLLHAACHGPTLSRARIRQACRRYGAGVIEWTEAYRRNRYLRTRLRFRMVVGKSKTDPRRGPKDNPLLVRRGYEVIDRGAVKACDASTPHKIAPERWISWAIIRHLELGVIGVYALHPNAAVVDAWESDRAAKYRQQMQALIDLVRANRARYHVDDDVVSGDLNYHENDPVRDLTPRDVFEQLGMDFWCEHLDWIAWTPGLEPVEKRVIPTSENGQDHPWLLVRFIRAMKRRRPTPKETP
jgi:hypothetical protein